MAFPTIPSGGQVITGVQTGTVATRTFPSLSGLTSAAGDLIIAICFAYQTGTGTNAAFSGWTGGFTEFGDFATTTTLAIGAAYKISSGAETGTFAVTQAGTITGEAAFIVMSIPGGAGVPVAGGAVSSISSTANSGSLTSGFGAMDTLWITAAGCGEDATTGSFTGLATTNPANYSGTVATAISADVVGGVNGAVSFRQLNAVSEDPAALASDTSNARWTAITIAVKAPTLAGAATVAAVGTPGNDPAVGVNAGVATVSAAATAPVVIGGSITLANSAEGIPDATTLTAGAGGNTGGTSGNPLDEVSIAAGCTVVGSSATSAHGSRCIQITSPGSALAYTGWTNASMTGAPVRVYFRYYVNIAAPGALTYRLANVLSGSALCAGMNLMVTTGFLRLVNAAAGTIATSTVSVATGSWVRVEGYVQPDATGAAGDARLQIFSTPDSTTPDYDSGDLTGLALSTATTADHLRVGVLNSVVTGAVTLNFDDLGFASIGPLGPATGAPSATANAGVAAVSAVATPVAPDVQVNAGAATVSATAPGAALAVQVNAVVATVATAAPQPTVTTSGNATANAGPATVSALGLPASPGVTVFPGAATVSATAPALRVSVAPNAAPAIAATARTDVRAGAYLDLTAMGQPDVGSAEAAWVSITSRPLSVRHVYFTISQSSFTYDAVLQADAAAGVKVNFAFRPSYNPVSATELAAIDTFLATCKAGGLKAGCTIWHEPFFQGLTALQYTDAVAYYGPTIRAYYPLAFVTAATAVQSNGENAYYPGDGAVDRVATDLYAGQYYSLGTRLDACAAAAPAKPFGLWEYGSDPAGNFLAGQNIGFEGGNGNWVASTNCATVNTAVQFRSGSKSLQMTSIASGDMTAASCGGSVIATQGFRCVPGDQIVTSSWVRAAAATATCKTGAQFYTSAGASISVLLGSGLTDSSSAWTNITASVTAPATAAYWREVVVITTAGASEVHYTDDELAYNATTLEFYSYIQDFFTGRKVAGKPSGDLMFQNNTGASGTVITSGADYRVPALQAIFDALDTSTGTGATASAAIAPNPGVATVGAAALAPGVAVAVNAGAAAVTSAAVQPTITAGVTLLQSFENVPDSTRISAANSGGGGDHAVDEVSVAAGCDAVGFSTAPAHGARCLRVTSPGSAVVYWGWTNASMTGSPARVYFRLYVKTSAPGAATYRLANILSGTTLSAGLNLMVTTGFLRLINAASATVLTSNVSVATGAWVRVEGYVESEVSGAAGKARLLIYSTPDSVTADYDSGDLTGQAFGTAASVDRLRTGVLNSVVTGALTIDFDDVGFSSAGPLGPASGASANAGAATVGVAAPPASGHSSAWVATASAIAMQPTVTTSSGGTANAGVATVAAVAPAAKAAIGVRPSAATATTTPAQFGWIFTANNIHLIYGVDPVLATARFSAPTAFGTKSADTANAYDTNPIQDGLSTNAVLRYSAYTGFAGKTYDPATQTGGLGGQADPTGTVQTVPGFADDIANNRITFGYKWILYDTEYWVGTPRAESIDPWTYIRMFADLAHANGYGLIVTPARDLGNDPDTVHPNTTNLDTWYMTVWPNGDSIAKASSSCEIFVIQTQVDTGNLTAFDLLYTTCRDQVRATGADCQTWCEVSNAFPVNDDPGNVGPITTALLSVDAPGSFFSMSSADISTIAVPVLDQFWPDTTVSTNTPGSAPAGVAVVSAVAPAPTVSVRVNAAAAAVTATAPQPTVTTLSGTTAFPGAATVAATATPATVRLAVNAQVATVAAVAAQPAASIGVNSRSAAVAGAAVTAQAGVGASALAATTAATAVTPRAGVKTGGGVAFVSALAPTVNFKPPSDATLTVGSTKSGLAVGITHSGEPVAAATRLSMAVASTRQTGLLVTVGATVSNAGISTATTTKTGKSVAGMKQGLAAGNIKGER